ncbi:MAG: hypothetical protein AABY13_00750 [Nanoarchaeota archaeon]
MARRRATTKGKIFARPRMPRIERLPPIKRPRIAPLNSAWFLSSIVGIIVSVGYVSKISLPWAAAFTVVFAAMFFAGLLSMSRAMPDDQLAPMPRRTK